MMPCIHCGACVPVCPRGLWPQQLFEALGAGDLPRAQRLGLEACGACRQCQDHCPSGLPLTKRFREGQDALLALTEAEQVKALAQTRFLAREQRRAQAEAEALEAKRQRRAEAKRRAEARQAQTSGVPGRQDAQRAALARALAKAEAEDRLSDATRLRAALTALDDPS